ncbi:MAG TPA: low temperature requirement protein A [Actinomycetes bacterium]|jgi:low temperature requirement protein LtrA|nr:low temperature requirement protein A [Actinomycetes bacterium]
MSPGSIEGPAVEIERVSTLELFLDLVFVFTVTQLTELVSHPTGSVTTARRR